MSRKEVKRLRFTSDDDLALLKETLAQNPLQNPIQWKVVQENLVKITGKQYFIRALKDHLQLLIDSWIKKDKVDKVRSGVEETYSERDILLQEIVHLCEEFNLVVRAKGKPIPKERKIVELGCEIREKNATDFTASSLVVDTYNEHNYIVMDDLVNAENSANTEMDACAPDDDGVTFRHPSELSTAIVQSTQSVTNIAESSTSNTPRKVLIPTRKRLHKSVPLKKTALEYLKDKHNEENKIKSKELELEEKRLRIEERKISLQEQQFQTELEERKQLKQLELMTREFDLKERQQHYALLEAQQKLIDNLTRRLEKYEH